MTEPQFRSTGEQVRNGTRIYQGIFADSPNAYLVLTPDLVIINGNAAYLDLTGRHSDEIADRFLFDVFPDNPTDPHASGVRTVSASFARVLSERRRDTMPLLRYDICHNGVWQPCFWYPTNWPIVDDDGRVVALISHVKRAQVPAQIGDLVERSRKLLERTTAIADELQAAVDQFTQH